MYSNWIRNTALNLLYVFHPGDKSSRNNKSWTYCTLTNKKIYKRNILVIPVKYKIRTVKHVRHEDIFIFNTIRTWTEKLRQINICLLGTSITCVSSYGTSAVVGTCKGMDGVQRAAESLVKDVADSGPATQL